MTIASLPMYDLAEVREATDTWWGGLAAAFRRAGVEDVPDRLDRTTPLDDQWRGPDLLLSQACGYPVTHAYRDCLRIVATPCYAVPGCAGPRYSSAVVVRADSPVREMADLRGGRCAFNSETSQSGYNCLRALVAPHARGKQFFAEAIPSGAHGESLAMVRDGRADVAALDSVTFALIGRHRPELVEDVRVLAWAPAAPGLPYVTRAGADEALVARLREGLVAAAADLGLAEARAALALDDVAVLPDADYASIVEMEKAAVRQGYPRLA